MNRSSMPHLSVTILCLIFTPFAPDFRAQGDWQTIIGPDKDFVIDFPSTPAHETKKTPQKPFTGQKIELCESVVENEEKESNCQFSPAMYHQRVS